MLEALVVLAVGLFLVTLLFKALIALVLLPFRLVGAIMGLVGRILLGLGKLFGGLVVAVVSVLALAFAVLLLPLAPILLVVGVVWLLTRRPKARVLRAA